MRLLALFSATLLLLLLSSLAIPSYGAGGNYELLNRLIGSLKFEADTSHIDDITVEGPVNVDVYIRLPDTVSCENFGVSSVDVKGALRPGKENGMERYDLGISVDGLRFKCFVPLCIKTSLPLNDWDCDGSITLESRYDSGTRVSVEQMILSKDFSKHLPTITKVVPTKCEDRVKMDGVAFTAMHIKQILGVDTTPFVQKALSVSEKNRALDPIRSAVCAELDKAAASMGDVALDNPVVRLIKSLDPHDGEEHDPLSLENDLQKQLNDNETLVDISSNIFTRVVFPPKDGVIGVAIDNPVVSQLLAATGVPASALSDAATLLPAVFEKILKEPLPKGKEFAFDVLGAAEVLLKDKSASSKLREYSLDLPGIGSLSFAVDSLELSLGGPGLGQNKEMQFLLLGHQTVGLPKVELNDLRAAARVSFHADVSTTHVLGKLLEFVLDQEFRVDMQAGQLVLGAALLLAIDASRLGELQIGPMIDGHLMQCALSSFRSMPRVTQLTIASAALKVGVSGFTDAIGVIIQDLANAVMHIYLGRAPAALEAFLSSMVGGEPLVNESEATKKCPQAQGNQTALIDFSQGLAHKISEFASLEKANELIHQAHLESTVEVISSHTELLTAELPRIGGIAPQQVAIAINKLGVHLQGLDDLAVLSALPSTPHTLHSQIAANDLAITVDLQLDSFESMSDNESRRKQKEVRAAGGQSAAHSDSLMTPGQGNLFNVNLSVGNLEAALDVLAAISEMSLATMRLRETVNLDCWLGRLAPPDGGQHNSSLELLESDYGLTCAECDSLLIRQISDRLGEKAARQDLASLASSLKNRWLQLVQGRFRGDDWAETVRGARVRCESESHRDEGFLSNSIPAQDNIGSLESDQSDAHKLLAGLALMLVIFGSLILIPGVLCPLHPKSTKERRSRRNGPGSFLQRLRSLGRRSSSGSRSSVPESPGGFQQMEVDYESDASSNLDGTFDGWDQQDHGDGMGVDLQGVTESEREALWRNPRVPFSTRIAMPALLLVNLAFFIYGHVGYVIRISVIGTLLGGKIELANLAQFSVVTSTQELWKGGAIALAVLISVFSIIWPYFKLLLLGLSWFASERQLCFKSRGKLLYMLDIVGKWSMIELFVVSFVLIFLNIPIDSPDATISFLPPDLFTFQLAVLPQSNLYTFILALLLSLALSSVAATHHELIADRAVLRKADQIQVEESSQDHSAKLSVVQLAFMGRDPGPSSAIMHSLRFARKAKIVHGALLGGVAVCLLLTLIAASSKVLHVEILGLVGRAMELGGSAAVSEYSLISFVSGSLSTDTPMGQACLALVIFLVSFLIPVTQLALLAFLALPSTRLSLKQALHIRLLNQMLCAFSALEVFLLGVGVSVLELGMLTRSLLADQCDGAQTYITGVLLPMDLVTERDAQAGCFALDAKLLPSLNWFLLAVFLSNMMNLILSRFALEKFIAVRSNTPTPDAVNVIDAALADIELEGSGDDDEGGMRNDASVRLIFAEADHDSTAYHHEREQMRAGLEQALEAPGADPPIVEEEDRPPTPPPRPAEQTEDQVVPWLEPEIDSAIEMI